MRTTTRTEHWDAVIVGAGPAGMFAALALAAGGRRDVLVIDAGPDVDDRRAAASGHGDTLAGGHPSYEEGIGGAGLYSDGKLCLSLAVGGELDRLASPARQAEVMAEVCSVIGLYADLESATLDAEAVRSQGDAADAAGLAFKTYAVAQIGTDRCAQVIRDLRGALLALGVTIRPHAALKRLGVRGDGRKRLDVVGQGGALCRIHADTVVLAMGKVGAAQQDAICRGLGITSRSRRLYIGVRFEGSAAGAEPLFAATRDPKFAVRLADGSKVKTHCASRNGEVLELRYGGLPLSGAHNYSTARTDRSGFSLLWDGWEDRAHDGYQAALRIMERAQRATGGHLAVQRVNDYRAGRATSRVPASATCREAVPGDVRAILPADYFPRCDDLLARLEAIAPDLVDDSAVMYAPSIEWWMRRIDVADASMETAVDGLFVCGDGSGWSQGIIHAAATGLLAGWGAVGTERSIATALAGSGCLAAA